MQLVKVFLTVKVALYVFIVAPEGIVMTIGVLPKVAFTTSTKPLASAAASKSIEY